MSSRGRGYGGRGGYNSRGGGYRGYRGGGRGSYEHRGGRGGSYTSYNNDSRYNTSGGNRYSSSRDNRLDDSYKKYRSETSGYSTREYGGRAGSPDRKRMRIEGSSSDRRSHDGGGHHYSGSYSSSRQESYGGGERRSFVSDGRRRSPSREGYRKQHMGPPRDAPRSTMRSRAPRRSFRGRMLRSRATYRGAMRSRASFTTRRFTDRSLGYTRAFRSLKARSPAKSKDEASSTDEDWDGDDKEETPLEKKESKAKSPHGEDEEEEVGSEGEAGEGGEDTEKEGEGGVVGAVRRARPLVRLLCVHCKEKAINFGSYAKHLMTTRHRAAMGGVARRHKAQLLRMRVAQRAAQRDLEASAEELAPRTTFCLICRLNHRTTRHDHNLTDTHRAMKRFLMPYCRVCRLAFRSPMMYEHHICSIDHLKRKANQAARTASSPKAAGSADEGMDVDLDNFMTLDSVGDVDEVEDEDSGTEKKDDSAVKKPKVEINIGNEHIKKCEVYWCELCRVYLPRCEAGSAEEGEALRRHCRLRLHLGRYVQHRDTRTLRRHAERIHRQLHRRREEEKTGDSEVVDKVKIEKKDSDEAKAMENGDAANAGEDKMWADVDKDIGELLREVDPQGHEGSEDEDDLGRYDKFRKSDKAQNGDGEENEGGAVAAEEKNKAAEVETV